MTDAEKLDLLTHIATLHRAPLHTELAPLAGLVRCQGWPRLSLTPEGWAEFDRLTQAAYHTHGH